MATTFDLGMYNLSDPVPFMFQGGPRDGGGAAVSSPVNTAGLGSQIAQYNLSAVAGDPRLNPIMRNIQGVIPGDLRRNIEQAAAERGVGIGAPNSANANTQLLKSLGLTTYDLMNQGVQQYRDLLSGVPKLDPGLLFVSAGEQASNALKRQLQAEQIAAELQRQREANDAALLRSRESNAAGASAQANELAFKANQLNADRERSASSAAATARMIDSILNRNTGDWGGNEFTPGYTGQNDAWTGGGTGTDFFGYLENIDPNLMAGNETPASNSYGGFTRDFSVDTGVPETSSYGAPEGYTFENYDTGGEDYGASDMADFEYYY
jgi:hypothetical protein